MAEYKGLTIRIGGDTSQLNTALTASTKAASSLQSQIRQITRAMNFNPGDIGNVETRIRLTTNRAEALRTKLELVRSAYKELAAAEVEVGGKATTVEKLAKSTDNVGLAATTAKERYNEMTAALAANYRELEARAKEAGKAMNLNALSRQGSDSTFERQMAELKKLGAVTDDEIQKLREMRSTWKEAFASSEAWKAANQLQGMEVDMRRLDSESKSLVSNVRELNTVSKYSKENFGESAAKLKSIDAVLGECTKQARAYEDALRENPKSLEAAFGRVRALSGAFDAAGDKAKELSQQVNEYRSRLSETLSQERNLPKFIRETGDAWEKVHAELDEAKGEVNALQQSLQRLKDTQAPVEDIQRLEGELREAKVKQDELSASAQRMDAAFETAKECSELQRLEGELAEAEAKVVSLNKKMAMRNLSGGSMFNASTIKSLGMSLYSTLTPALTMVGWRMVTAADDIDSAYRNMRKTVDGTEEQFEALRAAAVDFSKTHVTSADQILEIEAIGGQLGIAVEDLGAFGETVSNLSVAVAGIDTETLAVDLGKLANIMHMEVGDYDNFGDALVRLGNNFPAIEGDIIAITARFAAMATIVGMAPDQILAIATAATATGQQAEAAGGSLQRTLGRIEAAASGVSEQMSNLDDLSEEDMEAFEKAKGKLQAYADVANMTAEDFAALWDTDAASAFQAFVEGLKRIDEEGGSVDSTLQDLGIKGIRDRQLLEGLTNTTNVLADAFVASADAYAGVGDEWGAAGDAAREAQKKAEGFSGQFQILKNIANDALAELAEGATPLIASLNDLATTALDAFQSMSQESKTAVVKFMAVAAVAGPFLTLAATLVTMSASMGKFLKGASAMSTAARLMGVGATGATGAVRGLIGAGSKAGLYGLAAAAVVAAGALGYKAYQDYKKSVDDAKLATEGFLSAETSGFAAAQGPVEESLTSTRERIRELKDAMTETADMVRGWQDSWTELGTERSKLDYYIGIMEELAGQSDLTKTEVEKLRDAVEHYNEITGDTVTVNEDFSLSKTRDELRETAKEWYSLAAAEQYQKQAGEVIERRAELEMELQRQRADMEAAQRVLDEARANQAAAAPRSPEAQRWGLAALDAEIALADLEAGYDSVQKQIEQCDESIDEMFKRAANGNQEMLSSVLMNGRLAVALDEAGVSASDFADFLDAIGIREDSLDTLTTDSAKNLATWYKALDMYAGGLDMSVTDLATDLQEAGIATGGLADVGVEEFARLYQEANGDMSALKGLIDAYKQEQIANQVELDAESAMDELETLNRFEIGDKVYLVSSDGTTYDETEAVVDLRRGLAKIGDTVYKVDDHGTTDYSIARTRALYWALDETSGNWQSYITATVYGESSVDNLLNKLRTAAQSWTASLSVWATAKSATGSVSDSPYVPQHAKGYIAAGPTLTNNGWVGEAGAEAVLNWGTGGAVVPLTNRRYMEPIAREIARSMAPLVQAGGGTTNVYNVGGVTYDDGSAAARAVGELVEAVRMEVRR